MTQRDKLIALGAEVLADTLLNLAVRYEGVDDHIDRMVATPEENAARFKKRISGIKRRRRFVDWRGVRALASELEGILEDLKAGVIDPRSGVELLISFYETDKGTLGNCDDSSGFVGNVYRFSASELFVTYASRCDDKKRIASMLVKLNRKDDYGIRDTLVHCAAEFLPESQIRSMVAEFKTRATKAEDEFEMRHYLLLVESLARQIKDTELFKKTRLAMWGDKAPGTAACIEIAKVYFDSGKIDMAHDWVLKAPVENGFMRDEREALLVSIYDAKGDVEKQAELLLAGLRRSRSLARLNELVAAVGEEDRGRIVDEEISMIMADERWRVDDVRFLVDVERLELAEAYVLKNAEQIDGDLYNWLLPLGDTFVGSGKFLAASLIYRSLMVSILDRAYYKAYPFAAKYLKKLDLMSESVLDWKRCLNHRDFMAEIQKRHGRKSSFWDRYNAL